MVIIGGTGGSKGKANMVEREAKQVQVSELWAGAFWALGYLQP